YGAADGGHPKALTLKGSLLYGVSNDKIFRCDTNTGAFVVIASEEVSDVKGVLPDGSLIGNEKEGSSWWKLSNDDASTFETIDTSQGRRKIVSIGPDGAIYSVSFYSPGDNAVYRQASFYSPPVALHQFVNSPEHAKGPKP